MDEAHADWVELSMLVEEAWRSVAPPRVVNQAWQARPVPAAPSARVTTDPEVARKALTRVQKICAQMPDVVCDKESRHATFRTKKKVFAYFLDNHHGDGAIVICVKGDKREHARLLADAPSRYLLPAYIGSRGYLGIRLDGRKVDWDEVEARLASSYAAAAPKRARAIARKR